MLFKLLYSWKKLQPSLFLFLIYYTPAQAGYWELTVHDKEKRLQGTVVSNSHKTACDLMSCYGSRPSLEVTVRKKSCTSFSFSEDQYFILSRSKNGPRYKLQREQLPYLTGFLKFFIEQICFRFKEDLFKLLANQFEEIYCEFTGVRLHFFSIIYKMCPHDNGGQSTALFFLTNNASSQDSEENEQAGLLNDIENHRCNTRSPALCVLIDNIGFYEQAITLLWFPTEISIDLDYSDESRLSRASSLTGLEISSDTKYDELREDKDKAHHKSDLHFNQHLQLIRQIATYKGQLQYIMRWWELIVPSTPPALIYFSNT
ncbi:hypothetical protein ACWJJH_04730 [Endozoicomonadaceae bacterium StTr2]